MRMTHVPVPPLFTLLPSGHPAAAAITTPTRRRSFNPSGAVVRIRRPSEIFPNAVMHGPDIDAVYVSTHCLRTASMWNGSDWFFGVAMCARINPCRAPTATNTASLDDVHTSWDKRLRSTSVILE